MPSLQSAWGYHLRSLYHYPNWFNWSVAGHECPSRGAYPNCGGTVLSVGEKLIALLITGNKFVVVFVGAPQKDNNNVRIHNKTAGDFNMLHYIPEGTT